MVKGFLRRILDVLGCGLLKDFPNPSVSADGLMFSRKLFLMRCLSRKLINRSTIWDRAARAMRFHVIRRSARMAQKAEMVCCAAVIILGLAVGGWALFHDRNENLTAQTAVLDLRDLNRAGNGSEVRRNLPRN